jgi:hypothetical protein
MGIFSMHLPVNILIQKARGLIFSRPLSCVPILQGRLSHREVTPGWQLGYNSVTPIFLNPSLVGQNFIGMIVI